MSYFIKCGYKLIRSVSKEHVFFFRKFALTIILTRAGLDLDPHAMKKYFFTVIKLAMVPWTFECVLCAVLSHFLLGLPWDWCKYYFLKYLLST